MQVPKTADHDGDPFYPQSLDRGRRSVRAAMLAVAEMDVKGVPTREVEAVMREFGIESLSSSQVSRAAKLLDDELQAWREVWNAGSLAKAEAALAELVTSWRDTAPKLAAWLEDAVPEGLAVFSLPAHHRRRLRTSNPMEGAIKGLVVAKPFPPDADGASAWWVDEPAGP